ncbi:MAG: NAD-dependent epimerase/dehydratase family protein [Janthinobacterium lividum]
MKRSPSGGLSLKSSLTNLTEIEIEIEIVMNVFLTGASGYIGGSLAEHLRDAGFVVTGLVRSEEKAAFLRNRGIAALVGSLADADLLSSAAHGADVVINTAEADDAALVRNLLSAIEGTGKGFIHTSGSSIAVDDAQGAFASDIIHIDDMPYSVMEHRRARFAIDVMVRSAGITGGIRAAVICPTTVYGEGHGWKRNSHQIPLLVAKSTDLGAGVYIGEGRSVWSNVFLDDLLGLYALAAEKAPSAAFFFAENGEASWIEVAGAISASLGFQGRIQSWPLESATAEFGAVARVGLATNCRVRATNARNVLGWTPNGPSLAAALANGM